MNEIDLVKQYLERENTKENYESISNSISVSNGNNTTNKGQKLILN